jgi:hypothetical protein
MMSPEMEVDVVSQQQKNPPKSIERAGTYDGVMHPKRLDILREHVVIRCAVAIRIGRGVHGGNVPV